jgi:SAM-dependent methyltransferase
MHAEAMDWLRKVWVLLPPARPLRLICELGARDLNGSPRDLLVAGQEVRYVGVDLRDGKGVDVVADGADWNPGELFDLCIAAEMLEHTPRGEDVCASAYRLLVPGGIFLITAATGSREAHSGIDGGPLRDDEYYANVSETDLRNWLAAFAVVLTQVRADADLYALALK